MVAVVVCPPPPPPPKRTNILQPTIDHPTPQTNPYTINQDRWLSGVVVAVAHDEGLVKCEYSHDARWVETSGEEICLPNTHFSRELDNVSPQVGEDVGM